jgi:hypothetical protein
MPSERLPLHSHVRPFAELVDAVPVMTETKRFVIRPSTSSSIGPGLSLIPKNKTAPIVGSTGAAPNRRQRAYRHPSSRRKIRAQRAVVAAVQDVALLVVATVALVSAPDGLER